MKTTNSIRQWRRKVAYSGVFAAMLSAGAAQALDAPIYGMNHAEKVDKEYIVVLKQNSGTLSMFSNKAKFVSAAASDIQQNVGAKIRSQFNKAITGFSITATEQQIEKIAQNPLVDFIEVNRVFTLNGTQNGATWGLDRIDQESLPLDNTYNYDQTGAGVDVYIIDTGINASHQDFQGRIGNGYDAIDNDNSPDDCQGHGTHVAGTVAGSTWGVAKGATIHGVRVLNCQSQGTLEAIVNGVEWVVNNASGDSVANMSLGGSGSSTIDNAVKNGVQAGITFVVAAGNDTADACGYSPARTPEAITVGSSDNQDSRSHFSNYGSCIDIFAPGSDIVSASYNSNSGSTSMSGTSMASPHVAGAAALYLEANPGSSPSQVTQGLVNNAVNGKLSDVRSGSPNLLLNISGGSTPPPPPLRKELKDDQPIANLSGNKGGEDFYTFEVPAGATNVQVQMSGGSGDADLYVKLGSKPTSNSYDCRPYKNGNEETCDLNQTGTYHVMLQGYSDYSSVTLVGRYELDTQPPPTTNELENGVAKTGIAGSKDEEKFFTFEVPAGSVNVSIQMSGGSGDADLYVKLGSKPTASSYDCRPYQNGNNETCQLNGSGTFHVLVRGYSTFSDVTLLGQYGEDDTNPPNDQCDGVTEWNAQQFYSAGDEVTVGGKKYQAQYSNYGVNPAYDYYGYWLEVGSCD